jgi:hypothetical protein
MITRHGLLFALGLVCVSCIRGTPRQAASVQPAADPRVLGCYETLGDHARRWVLPTFRLDSQPGGGGAFGRKGFRVSLGRYRGGYWQRLSPDSLEIAWTYSGAPALWDATVVRVGTAGDAVTGTWRHSSDVRAGDVPRDGTLELRRVPCDGVAPD